MNTNGSRPRQRHPRRRLAIAACVLALAVVSATAAVTLIPSAKGVAVGGQLPVHPQPTLGTQLPDGPLPPNAPQPISISVPSDPHLTVPILY
jgi:hypothetical protein